MTPSPKARDRRSVRYSDVRVASGYEGQQVIEGILRVVIDEAGSETALTWAIRRLARSSLNRFEAEQRLFEVAVACGWHAREACEVIDKYWPQRPKQTKMKL